MTAIGATPTPDATDRATTAMMTAAATAVATGAIVTSRIVDVEEEEEAVADGATAAAEVEAALVVDATGGRSRHHLHTRSANRPPT